MTKSKQEPDFQVDPRESEGFEEGQEQEATPELVEQVLGESVANMASGVEGAVKQIQQTGETNVVIEGASMETMRTLIVELEKLRDEADKQKRLKESANRSKTKLRAENKQQQESIVNLEQQISQLQASVTALEETISLHNEQSSSAETGDVNVNVDVHTGESEAGKPKPEEEDPEQKPEEEDPEPKPEEEDPEPGPEEDPEIEYIDIDPKKIYENLDETSMGVLKAKIVEYYQNIKEPQEKINKARKILQNPKTSKENKQAKRDVAEAQKIIEAAKQELNDFYKEIIRESLIAEGKEDKINEENLDKAAELANDTILQTVENMAQKELMTIKKKFGGMLGGMAKNGVIMAGAAALISSLGIATGGAGIVVLAGGMTVTRLLTRKISGAMKGKNADKTEAKFQADLDKEKDKILENMFDKIDDFREEMSGQISNAVREQTSGGAIASLRKKHEKADEAGNEAVMDSSMRDLQKEFYLRSLTKIKAENPDLEPEQQQQMAIQMAMALSQHEKTESDAAKQLKAIKASKPKVYAKIEKYNWMSAGQKPDKKPDNLSEEEEGIWDKYKYDLLSIGIGTAVGVAVRTQGWARIAMGAVAGGGAGYMAAEAIMDKKQEKKIFKEITDMINESETVIEDINFPAEELDSLRENSRIVQSRLELGLLDSNPLLKSRAENFIHNVTKVEINNMNALNEIVDKIKDNGDDLEIQMEADAHRIGKTVKKRKVLAVALGAAIGGLAAWAGKEYMDDVKEKAVEGKEFLEDKFFGGDGSEEQPGPGDPDRGADTWKNIQNLYDKPDAPEVESDSEFFGLPTEDQPEVPEVPADGPLEDIIKTEADMKGSDSIWRSTKHIVMNNPERFGYDGDPANTADVSQFAENQTANMVNALNVEQDGNLADLVHDGDKVTINFEGGKPVLSFEADSGIEASHLSDENVEAFFADRQWEQGIEHCIEIDPNTGDQYYEIDASDGTYKIYDWDRDGNPNVIFPDGHSEEMSADKLNSLFEEKNIFMSTQEVTAADQEAIQVASERSVDQFLSGESKYNENLYDDAKASGKLDEVFHKLLGTGDKTKITPFIEDHFKSNNLSENELGVFLRYAYSNQGLAEFDGSPADLVSDFESQAVSNFGELKGGNADVWRTVKVGDQYALVQKFHTGMMPFRSDHYFVDFDGNGEADTQLDHDAMQAVYNKGYFGDEAPVASAEAVTSAASPEALSTGSSEPAKVEETEPAAKQDRVFETSKASYRGAESTTGEPATETATEPAASPEAVPNPLEASELPSDIGTTASPKAVQFMKDHDLNFKDGTLVGIKGSGPLYFETAPGMTDTGVTESINLEVTGEGNLRGVVVDTDGSKDIFEVTPKGDFVDIKGSETIIEETPESEPVKAPKSPGASKAPEPIKPGVYDFSETEPAVESNIENINFPVHENYNNPEDIAKMEEAVKFLEDRIERDQQTLAQAESDFKAADEALTKAQETAADAAKVDIGIDKDDTFAKMDADFNKTAAEMDAKMSESRLGMEKGTLDREQANLEDSKRSLDRFKELAGEGKLGKVKYEFHQIKTGTGGTSMEHDVFKHDFETAPETSTPSLEPVLDASAAEASMDSTSLAVESLNAGKPALEFSMGKIATANPEYLNEIKENINAMLVVLEMKEGEEAQRLAEGYKTVLAAVEDKINTKSS